MPQLDYDIGQDMGLDALQKSISGFCQVGVKNTLVAMVILPQYTASHPAGRISLTATSRLGDVQSWTHGAIISLVHSPSPGSPKWFKVTVNFVFVSGSQ